MKERAFGVHTSSQAKSLALGGLGPGPGCGWPLLGQGPGETERTVGEEEQPQPMWLPQTVCYENG